MVTERNPLYTHLSEELGIDIPVVAFTHCKDVAIAVINAGGMAVLGASRRTEEELEADIHWIRERAGSKPFGIDVMMPSSVPESVNWEDMAQRIPREYRAFIEKIKQQHNIAPPKPETVERSRGLALGFLTREGARRKLEVVLENRVPVLAAALGNPAFILEAAHARGIKVWGLVGNARQARREAEIGIDLIVAQGSDAAGHTPKIGTWSLVPQVIDAVKPTPVLLAGGVASGRQLAAALCLGAAGVWTGTIWLATTESDVDIIIKEKLLQATERDTIYSISREGSVSRELRTQWDEIWDAPDAPEPMASDLQFVLNHDLLLSIQEQRIAPLMGTPCGQGVGMVKEIKSCAQILRDLVLEALETFERMSTPSQV
ncbi:MAG: NAD(P)H-dependent flavin oxidoreductase [Dehalococcoidia bacterium]